MHLISDQISEKFYRVFELQDYLTVHYFNKGILSVDRYHCDKNGNDYVQDRGDPWEKFGLNRIQTERGIRHR